MRTSTTLCFIAVISSAGLAGCGSSGSGGNGGGGGQAGFAAGFISTGGTAGAGASAGIGGGQTIDPDAACLVDSRAGEQMPVDLYFMVDNTGSMQCRTGPDGPNPCPVHNGNQTIVPNTGSGPTRWEAEKTGLETFINDPGNGGIGVGIGFFPVLGGGQGGLDCNARTYVDPPGTVEVATLPGSAGALTSAIDTRPTPNGGTPTTASLDGALQHAQRWAGDHPDRRTALVYVTDGEPDGCDMTQNTVANAAALAQAALAGQPSIPTYVMGVGFHLESLNQIAANGGTTAAYLLDTGQDVAALFADALSKFRNRTISCNYTIPAGSSTGPIDFTKINVEVTIGGTTTLIGNVADASACGPDGGWYYDNVAAPTMITLCQATCDPVMATSGSSLVVLIGCKTVGPVN